MPSNYRTALNEKPIPVRADDRAEEEENDELDNPAFHYDNGYSIRY